MKIMFYFHLWSLPFIFLIFPYFHSIFKKTFKLLLICICIWNVTFCFRPSFIGLYKNILSSLRSSLPPPVQDMSHILHCSFHVSVENICGYLGCISTLCLTDIIIITSCMTFWKHNGPGFTL